MRYNNRNEVERIGAAGSYYEYEGRTPRARVLSSFWLYCDPNDAGFTPHMTTKAEGYWESWITLWMSRNVKPGSRCMDIGANHGYYTMFLLDHGCKVRAVEPQEYLAELIEWSAQENGFKLETKSVDRCAISDETGTATIVIPHQHGMNANIIGDHTDSVGIATEVDTSTLDDFREGKAYYDFIKVDVEGAEDKLFRGASKFIEENPYCVWLVEWRYNRMDHESAYEVAQDLFEKFDVTYVDFQGDEQPLTSAIQLWSQEEDWMLVLRRKNV